MRKLIIILFGLLCLILSGKANCQKLLKNIEFTFGYGGQPQDRRLFEFPNKEELVALERSRHDFQYDFLISKNVIDTKILTFSSGLGYSLFLSKFSRPFDHCYFNTNGEHCTYEGSIVKRYSIHSFKISNALKFNIIDHDKNGLSLVFPIDINIAFNKNVKRVSGTERQQNKTKIEFKNMEIYTGLKYRIDRIFAGIYYRVYNIQEIDGVIFNQILFKPTNHIPEFLTKKTETLNLDKLMINIGYQF